MEAFEALRVASARMLGVRKGGLELRISLVEKESIVPSCRAGALLSARACHAAYARWARKCLVADVRMRSTEYARAWRENSRFLARCKGAACEETLPICADCLHFALVMRS